MYKSELVSLRKLLRKFEEDYREAKFDTDMLQDRINSKLVNSLYDQQPESSRDLSDLKEHLGITKKQIKKIKEKQEGHEERRERLANILFTGGQDDLDDLEEQDRFENLKNSAQELDDFMYDQKMEKVKRIGLVAKVAIITLCLFAIIAYNKYGDTKPVQTDIVENPKVEEKEDAKFFHEPEFE